MARRNPNAPELRKRLVARDGPNCHWCGIHTHMMWEPTLPVDYRTIDRLQPGVNGGVYHEDNCVIACHRCNQKRSLRQGRQPTQLRAGQARMFEP